jgi:DNA-binding response OmpR family regulator
VLAPWQPRAGRRLRDAEPGIPCPVLKARDALPDRVEGLVAGLNDNPAKPFAADEWVERVRTLLRLPADLREL